ncbi:MAG: phosphoglycerate kinase [Acidobacteriota bacterium]|nr:phosphoglycerate kinase [Acidobacteriota bacterium]MDQ7088925.1 phosphoglycerate kinase [Acidobacteriota bacterium]
MNDPRRLPLVTDIDLSGKLVFCRVDFNVPLDGSTITDDRRIRAALPTIEHLRRNGARVVCASHLGRPKGQRRPEMSLAPVAARLAELLGDPVPLADDCIGPAAQAMTTSLADGQVGLLENLRFHGGETRGDRDFARALAEGFEAYVNDAFGAAHRAHASVTGVPALLDRRAAGLLMAREIDALTRLAEDPRRPYFAILGGAKVSDKIPLIDALLERVDGILVGGAMAYTFLAARGVEVGASRVEDGQLELARKLEERARARGVAWHLPVDHRVAGQIDGRRVSGLETTPGEAIDPGRAGVDIGPRTLEHWREVLGDTVRTVLWNGPVGFFEAEGCETGTLELARHLAGLPAFTVLGGGDTAAAAHRFGLEARFSHVSTGGGAALELLSGVRLPGVAALEGDPR